jgi:hypothetical protein
MSTQSNEAITESDDSQKKLPHLYSSKLKTLERIDKILQTRYEAAFEKNGYNRRTQKLELAWMLMTSRIVKLYYKQYNDKV